jgi:hypothetical protein
MPLKYLTKTIIILSLFIMNCSSFKANLDNPINASALGEEFASDATNSGKKYIGKYLTVYGEIAQSYLNKYQENIIVLIDKGKNHGVKCTLMKSGKPIEKPFKLGETIKINGKCVGFDEYVLLTGCLILKD